MRGEITDCSLDLHLHSAWINLLRDASRGIMPARPNRLSTNGTGSEDLHNFAAQTPPPIESRTERSSVRFSDDREHPLGVEA